MPRTNRKIARSNIYHIMLRGINKQEIFHDDLDRKFFIKILKETKEKYQYCIYAYCLMNNHVHLLIFDFNNKLSNIIQSLAIKYSLYFNKKYDRVGHLFQNRFKSKCVENEKYLLHLIRYIHQNPEKANICRTQDYVWSSYRDYVESNNFIDSEYIFKIFKSKNLFFTFNIEIIDDYKEDLEYEFINRLDDKKAERVIKETIGLDMLSDIKNYNVNIRNEYIRKIKEIDGISNIQISRILKLNRKVIERA